MNRKLFEDNRAAEEKLQANISARKYSYFAGGIVLVVVALISLPILGLFLFLIYSLLETFRISGFAYFLITILCNLLVIAIVVFLAMFSWRLIKKYNSAR